ncbi:hypothetical protein [Chitinimonas taiwanensis]|uniref:hypothetical protein n=1 Tax=Chitinimonas taiwanensis TaxID=240412 RepID=UPI0035B1A957
MKMKPFTNDTDHVIYLGNATIPPGQTRDVEETLHPNFSAEPNAPAEAEPTDPWVELLKGTVATVSAGLDGLSVDELNELGDAERACQNRKGVLGAIAEKIMALGQKTADAAAAGGTDKQGDE